MLSDIYKDIYVIGGNAAGLAAANQVKRVNPALDVYVLEGSSYISYGSCSLPYFISGTVSSIDDLFSYPKTFFEEKRNIRILLNRRVTSINTSSKEITTDCSSDKNTGGTKTEIYNYDRLVICSGSSPVKIDVPGISAKNVFYFHNVEDAINLDGFITGKKPKNAVIIGGGYTGLLLAEAFSSRGISSTVIEKRVKAFSFYENEITDLLDEIIKDSNIKIITGSSMEAVNLDRSSNTAYSVSIISETGGSQEKFEIDADIIAVSAGVRPNTDFARSSGIELGSNGAIKVSSKQQTSLPNIFAAGDCSQVRNLVTGLQDYIPTSMNAIKTGRVAGANAAGANDIFYGSAGTRIEKIFGTEFARTGIGTEEAATLNRNVLKISGKYKSHVSSIPGACDINAVLIVDKNSRKLLGAQMAGKEGVAKRIDTLATAVTGEMTVDEIYMLDLSYSPPVAIVPDVVNRICGKAVLALDSLNNL